MSEDANIDVIISDVVTKLQKLETSKKDIIQQGAKQLEQIIPKKQVAIELINGFKAKNFKMDKSYVYKVLKELGPDYSNTFEKEEQEEKWNSPLNDDNNIIEVSATGQQTVTPDAEDIDNPEKQIFKEIEINRQNGQQLEQPQQREPINDTILRERNQFREQVLRLQEEVREKNSEMAALRMTKNAKRTTVAIVPRDLFPVNQKAIYRSKTHIVLHIEDNQVDEIFDDKEGKQLLIDAGIEI